MFEQGSFISDMEDGHHLKTQRQIRDVLQGVSCPGI